MEGELPAWAHIRIDEKTGRVEEHDFADHLTSVAALAASFAGPDARDLAYLAGLWHDLGKYRPGFRAYIRQVNGVDAHIEGRVKDQDKTHSAAGAIWAEVVLKERFGQRGTVMARALQYVIAGHHAGLANWDDGDASAGLVTRLAGGNARAEYGEATTTTDIPPEVLRPSILATRQLDATLPGHEHQGVPGRFALSVRMLFSALVDADFRAKQTGFSLDDLELFFTALENMFEHDRSASRGEMSTRGLYIFKHESELGNAHAHALFDRSQSDHRPMATKGHPAPSALIPYCSMIDRSRQESPCRRRPASR